MPLPPPSFHPLADVAQRWQVAPFDIVTWAVAGRLALSVVLPPVNTALGAMSGLAEIDASAALPLVRHDAPPDGRVRLAAIRPKGYAAQSILDPPDGIAVGLGDIVIRHAELERFEFRHGLRAPPDTRSRIGALPRHDWDAFYGALARRIHERGIPRTQAELARDMLDWFDRRSAGAVPDERTVRKRISAVWRELSAAQ